MWKYAIYKGVFSDKKKKILCQFCQNWHKISESWFLLNVEYDKQYLRKITSYITESNLLEVVRWLGTALQLWIWIDNWTI